jgi:hypothetical protein
MRDAVPSEARDASLSLGMTDQETFFETVFKNLDKFKIGLRLRANSKGKVFW